MANKRLWVDEIDEMEETEDMATDDGMVFDEDYRYGGGHGYDSDEENDPWYYGD